MIGFDFGTYNLISCKRNDEGKTVFKKCVNSFVEIPLENDFVYNMMKKSGVPLIHREDQNVAYVIGDSAVNFAQSVSTVELRRPMKDGCVNPREKDSFQIMSIMAHNLLSNVTSDGELLYYSVPSNAVNENTDSKYHNKLLEAIFKAYKHPEHGFTVRPRAINEALAVVYSELESSAYTGVSASFGSGMVNVCYAQFGTPVFQFSVVNSGDWIDQQAARATGESVAKVNRVKHSIDLSQPPTGNLERAIHAQYGLMIEETVKGILNGIKNNDKAKLDGEVNFVLAGGTSLPNGFSELFSEQLDQQKMGAPFEIASVKRADDPLYSVARGCLIAAENSN